MLGKLFELIYTYFYPPLIDPTPPVQHTNAPDENAKNDT